MFDAFARPRDPSIAMESEARRRSAMPTIEELSEKYRNIPLVMKQQRRWVVFALTERNGKLNKTPLNPNNVREGASSTDPTQWGDFEEAIRACAENGLGGIGFELDGSGLIGVDLDNHPNPNGNSITQEAFKNLANRFVTELNSYTEWSVSGNGVHIFCYGKLPAGRRKSENVEMYDSGRFIAMTGKSIGRRNLQNREKEITALWKEFLDDSEAKAKQKAEYEAKNREYLRNLPKNATLASLSDDRIIEKGCHSPKIGQKFAALWNGDLSVCDGDHSKCDQAFCNYVAFFANCDFDQIDRIFRSSGLMREKWDSPRGDTTYGAITIQKAIDATNSRYYQLTDEKHIKAAPASDPIKEVFFDEAAESKPAKVKSYMGDMNLDDEGNPIFRVSDNATKSIKYEYSDTGNAKRFYDYFGEHFKYNASDKLWMFWTGKTWIYDVKGIIRKYVNQLLIYMDEDRKGFIQKIVDATTDEERKHRQNELAEFMKNYNRLANKNGKDAMLAELQTIGDMAIENSDLDKDPYTLNTDSGIVDLRTGEIKPFDRSAMLSCNTNTKVSFEEPTVFINFLNSIFERGDPRETEDIVACIQRCIGYTLTGLVDEQCMFLLHGGGSNGKSTLANVLRNIMGDYYKSIDSSQLMVQKNQSVAVQNSLAELCSCRYLVTQETDVGAKLSESIIKQLTGGDSINAQRKYGRPFQFDGKFKIWMMTNNLPIIRGTDYGVWRRIFLFKFMKQFRDDEKDKTLPKKLEMEYPKILGWAIKGAVAYLKELSLKKPSCLEQDLRMYRDEMDVVSKFLASECEQDSKGETTKNAAYNAFKSWCSNNNEYALPESKFRDELTKKGYEVKTRPNGVKFYVGFTLHADAMSSGYGSKYASPLEDD